MQYNTTRQNFQTVLSLGLLGLDSGPGTGASAADNRVGLGAQVVLGAERLASATALDEPLALAGGGGIGLAFE